MRDVKCSNCNKVFQIDESAEKAFCVYCGQSNEIIDAVNIEYENVTDEVNDEFFEWKKQIEAARFKVYDKRTGDRGDTFIGFWTMLMFHGRNSRGFFGLKRARKEADKFWQQSAMSKVIDAAGDQAEKLVSEQLYDSARVFYQTCREDRHYGSKMLDMVKLKPEQIAEKAAGEVCNLIFQYWLNFEPIMFRDQIFRAAWYAFAPSFPDKPSALEQKIKSLSEEEQSTLRQILKL